MGRGLGEVFGGWVSGGYGVLELGEWQATGAGNDYYSIEMVLV